MMKRTNFVKKKQGILKCLPQNVQLFLDCPVSQILAQISFHWPDGIASMYQRVGVDKCAAQLTDVVLTEDGSHLRERPLDSSTRSAISFTIATCLAAIRRLFMFLVRSHLMKRNTKQQTLQLNYVKLCKICKSTFGIQRLLGVGQLRLANLIQIPL